MSEFATMNLKLTDVECIKLALKEMDYVFEEHSLPDNLFGYQGDIRTQQANIIVRRKYIGSLSNDLGFLKNAYGNYDMIISEYDKGHLRGKFPDKFMQLYGKHKSLKQVKKMGYSVTSMKTEKNGQIKIRASKFF